MKVLLKSLLREVATLLTHRPAAGRRHLLAAYLPLKLRVSSRLAAKTAQFLELSIHYTDLDALVFMLEEVFIHEDYRFQCDREDPLILDCGSNIGVSVMYFKMLYPRATIYAFEPDPASFTCLIRNIADNRLQQVVPLQCALLDHAGKAAFASVSGALTSRVSEDQTDNTIEVETERLSRYIDRPVSFLKLDVQGVETSILHELAASGKLGLVEQTVIEYHHHLPGSQRLAGSQKGLDTLLRLLVDDGFDYQLSTTRGNRWTQGAFQDVLVFAYRPDIKR